MRLGQNLGSFILKSNLIGPTQQAKNPVDAKLKAAPPFWIANFYKNLDLDYF